MKQKQQVFKDFEEFWYHTRGLSERQRDVIFHSLPSPQQKKLQRSYRTGGWEDLFIRNQIDDIVNSIKRDMDFDLLYMRARVLMGKSYYMKKSLWQYINDVLGDFPDEQKQYVLGGITAQKVNSQVVLILKADNKSQRC